MIDRLEKSQCCGCYSCVASCPQDAIFMKCDKEGFWYPEIDKSKCISCNICEERCPNINNTTRETKHKAYICMNENYEIRLESSSGGIFSAIAEYVIGKNGVVFGAGFDENLEVCHSFVDNTFDLQKLRGSKYVQSKIGNVYKEVEQFLKDDRLVLFTGTPCQVEGLRMYLDKEYDNLICSYFICHGVSSPKVWRKFILEKENEFNSKIKEAYFRNKTKGWKKFSMFLKFGNDMIYRKDLNRDVMLRCFLSNICLRPSCHDCNFKNIEKSSDITLADFWEVDNVYPKMNDGKGISLCIINSERGEEIFKYISKDIIYRDIDFEKHISNIESLTKSAKENKNREVFFDELDNSNLDIIANKYCKVKMKEVIRFLVPRKIKLIIKRIIKTFK